MSNTLQLPFSGLTEEFKVAHTREALQYRDCKVSSDDIEVRTGRKWRVDKAVEVAESRLRQKALVVTLASGRAGVGDFPKTQVSKTQGKEIHHLLQEEVQAGLEEERVSPRLDVTGAGKKRAIKSASEAAEKATWWLWMNRADPWVTTGTQVGAYSTPARSPGQACML